ncbi:type II toxin-antitoxin system VapC family toxin [Moraxella sp. ZY21109]|uniref:type II toxin-antitoxin system VapC family toxin n=1 Tax=Moraxella sp. ZY21109 TaxID=2911969 RepID=UPI003D7D7366
MNILLDTHILIWYINQSNKLSQQLKELIEKANKIAISSATCFEIAWLVKHQRILLPKDMDYQDWIVIVKEQTDIDIIAIDEHICELAVNLPEHHKDPMDRLIIATALLYNYHLMSVDTKFSVYLELNEKLLT